MNFRASLPSLSRAAIFEEMHILRNNHVVPVIQGGKKSIQMNRFSTPVLLLAYRKKSVLTAKEVPDTRPPSLWKKESQRVCRLQDYGSGRRWKPSSLNRGAPRCLGGADNGVQHTTLAIPYAPRPAGTPGPLSCMSTWQHSQEDSRHYDRQLSSGSS